MHTIHELSQNIYTVFNGLLIEIDVPTEFSGSMQTSFLRYISGYVCSHAFVDGVLLLAAPVSSDLFERSTSGSQSRPPLSRPNSRSFLAYPVITHTHYM